MDRVSESAKSRPNWQPRHRPGRACGRALLTGVSSRVASAPASTLKIDYGKAGVEDVMAQRLRVDAASRIVRLALPASDGFTVRVTKASGKLTSGFPLKGQGGALRYGDGPAKIGVRLASGSVALDCVG